MYILEFCCAVVFCRATLIDGSGSVSLRPVVWLIANVQTGTMLNVLFHSVQQCPLLDVMQIFAVLINAKHFSSLRLC